MTKSFIFFKIFIVFTNIFESIKYAEIIKYNMQISLILIAIVPRLITADIEKSSLNTLKKIKKSDNKCHNIYPDNTYHILY